MVEDLEAMCELCEEDEDDEDMSKNLLGIWNPYFQRLMIWKLPVS